MSDASPSVPVAVVTGANSGIGRATAIHLAGNGYRVYGTVRDRTKAVKLTAMAEQAGVEVLLAELDIADDASVRDGLSRILDAEGPIDVLVNNAGVGGNAVVEETSPATYLEVMNINLCGAVRCQQQVLPGMRERGRGTIVNISSVVGRVAALAQSPYVTSKWALEAMSESLAQEVVSFGIRVAIVEPGITKSAIFAKNLESPNVTGAYEAHYRRMFQMYMKGVAQAADPREVAAVVLHAITTDSPQLRYPCAWGGPEMVAGRAAMSDLDWIGLGDHTDDADYYAAFNDLLGVDLL